MGQRHVCFVAWVAAGYWQVQRGKRHPANFQSVLQRRAYPKLHRRQDQANQPTTPSTAPSGTSTQSSSTSSTQATTRSCEAELWGNLQAIISSHEKGTVFGIGLDSDGLLTHGARLTWMDAEVNGEAVTPRAGKAVEIQALWYNALRTMRLLAEQVRGESFG